MIYGLCAVAHMGSIKSEEQPWIHTLVYGPIWRDEHGFLQYLVHINHSMGHIYRNMDAADKSSYASLDYVS